MDKPRTVPLRGTATRQGSLRAIERLAPPESRATSLQRVLVLLFSIGVIAAAGLGARMAVTKVTSRRIETVHIEGNLSFVTEEQIKQAVGGGVSTSLVAVNLLQLQEKLEALPWIRKAEISRQWPATLNIYVEEEIAIARWGQEELLNQQGQVFHPDSIGEGMALPLLVGPLHSETKVMRQYQEFNQLLYPLGVRIRDLTLNDSGSYELTLTNGVLVKLGREDVLARLRRLVVFLESAHGQDLQEVESIDLRYRNGLAVEHKRDLSGSAMQGNGKRSSVMQLPMKQTGRVQQHG